MHYILSSLICWGYVRILEKLNEISVSPPASAHKIRRRTATPSELLHPLKESLQGQVADKMHLEQLNEETPCLDQQVIEKARSLESSVEGGRLAEVYSVANVNVEAKNEVTKLIDLDLDDRGCTESPSYGRGNRRSAFQLFKNRDLRVYNIDVSFNFK